MGSLGRVRATRLVVSCILLLALFGPSRVLALTDNPQAQAALDNAQATWDRNEDDQALQLFQGVVNDFPDTEQAAEALAMVGLWWSEHKDPGKALAAWNRVLTDYPDSRARAEVWTHMGGSARADRDYTSAITYYEKVVATFPGSDEAARAVKRLAWTRVEALPQGQYAQAIAAYKALIAQYPDDPDTNTARLALGHNYLWANDLQAATEAYTAAMKEAGDSAVGMEARYYLGFVLGADDPQAAAAHFEAVLRSGLPESFKVRALLWRAGDYLRMKDYAAAERDCLAILSVASAEFRLAHPLAHVMLGDIYVDQKRYDEAIAEFELIIREYPGSPVAQAEANSVAWVGVVRDLAEQGWVAGEGGGQK